MKTIPLTQGYVALVDDEDHDRVARHKWRVVESGANRYAATQIEGRKVFLHHLIAGDQRTDHRNGDGLDCQRANLRPATFADNAHNSTGHGRSGFKGVSYVRQGARLARPWEARIFRGRKIKLGYFATAEEAARAYDEAARAADGEFACVNFPRAGERPARRMTDIAPYYDDGQTTVYCADNGEVLRRLPIGSVDLVFTSPPYNLGNTTGGGFPAARLGHYSESVGMDARGGLAQGKWAAASRRQGLAHGYGGHDDAMPHEEYVAWQGDVLWLCWSLLSERGAIFYNHKPRVLDGRLVAPLDYVPAALRPYVRQEIVWKRSGGINFSPAFYLPMHERIVVIARRDWRLITKGASGVGDVWEVHQETNNPHPAPFPIGLPARAIETTAPGLVLDPFAGSGTTLRAAKNAGVRSIGIDNNPDFCRLAVDRLAQAVLPFDLSA